MRRWYLVGLALLVVAGGYLVYVYAESGGLYRELTALRLIPSPERFTELYLNDYATMSAHLPTQIQWGNTISFSFSIHNREGRTVSYPYIVYMVGDSYGTTIIASKSVTVEAGATATIPVLYNFTSNILPVAETVFVTLTDQKQSLHFFVPNKG